MEQLIAEDSPLAELLEGQGRGPVPASPHNSPSPTVRNFAPRGPSTLRSRIRDKLPKPLRKAVNSRVGRADNQRFLEHFRYHIVASQLLNEAGAARPHGITSPAVDGRTGTQGHPFAEISPTGAILTGACAFTLAWLVHWSRRRPSGFSKSRIFAVLAFFVLAAALCYLHFRRKWLLYLRQQAVDGASDLVTNLQAFEASTSSALALIQEVELVSRGYRLSSPLPPISRIEEKGQTRRCHRLRRILQSTFAATIPVLSQQCGSLRQLIDEDDLERYLDVYDISNPDLQDAAQAYSASEFEDAESLKVLRILQYRLFTLRRVYLCSGLALEADGGKPDFARWASVVDSMLKVTAVTGEWSEKINRVLGEEEQFTIPSPQQVQPMPGRERLRNSVRKLSGLSQGIRGLQAKMHILRDESHKSLEETEDASELAQHLLTHYESIGADLKSLLQAWEAGRNALTSNVERHERRTSYASSGLRSPAPSLGGLTAVSEGSPLEALRALNGDLLSPRQSAPSSVESNSDDEIFEAIAIPKTRLTMTREERMQKIQDDRARQATLREQRAANTNMLKELESVIHSRPQQKSDARVTTL